MVAEFLIEALGETVMRTSWALVKGGARASARVLKRGAKKISTAKTQRDISIAAQVVKNGGIVAFPTETVYGLGGDALNPRAVQNIYAAKGRPGDNPLILHVATIPQFLKLANHVPDYAIALANAYWPGPLTLVVKKNSRLPSWVGGHPENNATTVGIRIPQHPTALALIKATGRPIAAPSANKAGRPSPTSAQHVKDDFGKKGEVDFIIEGEISDVGLESTVVDVTGDTPVILRPGAITADMIKETTGMGADSVLKTDTPRAPGMKYRHYAPKAPMEILNGSGENIANYIFAQPFAPDEKIGVLAHSTVIKKLAKQKNIVPIVINSKNLFASLRHFDKQNVTHIYAQKVHGTGIAVAIMDRMLKAAEGNIKDV